MRQFTMLTTAAVACGLVAGCATQGPQTTEQLTRARTLIEQAEKAQAQRYAAPDLQRARDELSSAEAASSKGDYDATRSYAESAAADADVATARASAAEALHAANEAQQGNRALEHESERAAEGGAATAPSPPPSPRSDLGAYPTAPSAPPSPPPDTAPPEPQTNPY